MLLAKRVLFNAAKRSQCRLALSSSCKLWAEKKNSDLVEDDTMPKWKKKVNVQASVLSQTLRQLRSDSENMAEKFGIPDETFRENGDIPGTSLLGLDRLKEKPPKPQKKRITPSVPLSSVERLGIFEKPTAEEQAAAKSRRLNLLEEDEQTWVRNWNRLKPTNNEFEALMEQPSYQYPIDNEVVKESEVNVGFQDHVLLDHFISDLPKKGPVRKFMQLVVTGLSKNPHYTVEEKQAHIQWYKDIFSTMSDEEVREMLAKKKRIRGKNKHKAENKT